MVARCTTSRRKWSSKKKPRQARQPDPNPTSEEVVTVVVREGLTTEGQWIIRIHLQFLGFKARYGDVLWCCLSICHRHQCQRQRRCHRRLRRNRCQFLPWSRPTGWRNSDWEWGGIFSCFFSWSMVFGRPMMTWRSIQSDFSARTGRWTSEKRFTFYLPSFNLRSSHRDEKM